MSSPVPNKPDLEETLSLTEDELAFFKAQTGIDDDEKLKDHIVAVQAKAHNVYPYPCIRRFMFTKFRASGVPAYPRVLELAKERKDAILLDVGCCFGCDLRKAVADGWPVENVMGFELRQAFWDYGHELFRSTPETCPAAFIAGDIFDSTVLPPHAPFYASNPPLDPRPDLKSLTSLGPLQGHVSAICASSFFHLFDEAGQRDIAQKFASLISPLPGSTIFGANRGALVKGTRLTSPNVVQRHVFCHSPDSWNELWDGEIFEKGTVRVETELIPVNRGGDIAHWMRWSVTRL
ncbi:hypothetical protein F5887DRAFT_984699 [Amanita rubescens]|nr:hypothetical protein F5887DRAFT_984699 [Amanita rubescens]